MELSSLHGEHLGYLGLLSSTLHEYGVMSKITSQLGDSCGKVSYGQRVGAMVLNGLGFCNRALYLTPHFFHDKPLSLLLGSDICSSDLNDDALGRCLDKISSYGVTKWYSELAFHVLQSADMLSGYAHLDSTTLSLYGSYESYSSQELVPCHGYSKDHRPDLKQVTLQCVSMGKSSLPMWMESLDGNSSDKESFPETVKRVDEFYKTLESAPNLRFIADSALYGPTLDSIAVEWLTRVPENYKEAKLLIKQEIKAWQTLSDDRYQVYPYSPNNTQQRWLLVRSEPAYQREITTFVRKHSRSFESIQADLKGCTKQKFNCKQDAENAIERIVKSKKHFYKINYNIVSEACFLGKGRPAKNTIPDRYIYKVIIESVASDYEAICKHKKTLGRFILATNVLDHQSMSDEEMLTEYKGQASVEAGFKFIKNDAIGLDNVYLKKPERIAALMAIMTLCLLIFGITGA